MILYYVVYEFIYYKLYNNKTVQKICLHIFLHVYDMNLYISWVIFAYTSGPYIQVCTTHIKHDSPQKVSAHIFYTLYYNICTIVHSYSVRVFSLLRDFLYGSRKKMQAMIHSSYWSSSPNWAQAFPWKSSHFI